MDLKLDISQGYDSVSWDFLFKVMQKFDFSSSWCDWLRILFESARIYVMVNGGHCGFFSMAKCLKQGDHLSIILLILMEEASSSRGLTKFVESGKIKLMVYRKVVYPT